VFLIFLISIGQRSLVGANLARDDNLTVR